MPSVTLNGVTYDYATDFVGSDGYGYSLPYRGDATRPVTLFALLTDLLAEINAQLNLVSQMEAIIWTGIAVVATNVLKPGLRVGRGFTVKSVIIRADTAPTGADLIVAVNKNGALFATVTLPAGTTSATLVGPNAALATGDIVTFDITQVGSTEPGRHIAVALAGA